MRNRTVNRRIDTNGKKTEAEADEKHACDKCVLGFPLWIPIIALLLCETIRIAVSADTKEDYRRLLGRFGIITSSSTAPSATSDEELYIPLDFSIVSNDAIMERGKTSGALAESVPIHPFTILSSLSLENDEKVKQGNDMLEWARSDEALGIEHHYEAAYFDYSKVGGPESILGVRASRDMDKGDILLKIPFNSMLTFHTVESDPVLLHALGEDSTAFEDTVGEVGEHPDYYLLPLVLLYHMSLGEKSKFYPYLKYIEDTDIKNFPLFLSDSEIDKLFPPADYPDIKRMAHEDRAFIARFHEKILVPLSKDFPELFGDNILVKGRPISSIDNYAWAFTMAKSRVWGPGTFSSLGDGNEPSAIPYLDDNEIHMLVPVGELMNFGPGGGCAECEGTYAERGKSDPDEMHFVCTITCPIKKGEEVHFWYNDDCKQDFAHTYGFVPLGVDDCRTREIKMNRVPVLPSSSPLSPSEKLLQGNAVLEWVKTELGIEHYHEAAYFNYSAVGGPEKLLGVKATRDMGRGDIVVKIPYTSLLTWGNSVEDDPLLRPVIGNGSKAFENAMEWFFEDGNTDTDIFDAWMLPLVLLYHVSLGEKSKFHIYIEYILDTDLSYFPIYMGNEKMEEVYPPIEYPKLMEKTKEDRIWAWEFHDKVLLPLSEEHPEIFGKDIMHKGKPILSSDNYMWASNMIASRYWGANFGDYPSGDLAPGRKNDELYHMAPVAELMNFGRQGGCVKCEGENQGGWYNGVGSIMPKENMHFVCRAWCSIKKGEEILYWYNDDCKQKFVRTYGFTYAGQKDCGDDE